ncbi:MAG: hypothetical protein CVU97_02970 [Firmicutes bacterium HGW-Firmicutes-21]|nr:MAG: hypothetical protein CVU97_02970 [Firmicutes bacterium HGW-Firmicutes-21]
MKRDNNGLTEEEFLQRYDASRFEKPSVTVDIILFDGARTLLIRRNGHPSIGMWALPGGFVEPDESAEQAALRELYEETGATGVAIKQLCCFSAPERDPRTRIITIAFTAQLLSNDKKITAGDDAAQAAWFDIRVNPVNKYDEDNGNSTFSVSEYDIVLINENEEIHCQIIRRTPILSCPADVIYNIKRKNPLAGDHAVILAAAIDSRTDIFGNLH